MKKENGSWWRRSWAAVVVLVLIVGLFAALWAYARPEPDTGAAPAEYSEYENGTVTEILTDNCEPDPVAEGANRGEQTLLAEVTTEQYKGLTLMVSNAVGPIYGEPAEVGQALVSALLYGRRQ